MRKNANSKRQKCFLPSSISAVKSCIVKDWICFQQSHAIFKILFKLSSSIHIHSHVGFHSIAFLLTKYSLILFITEILSPFFSFITKQQVFLKKRSQPPKLPPPKNKLLLCTEWWQLKFCIEGRGDNKHTA